MQPGGVPTFEAARAKVDLQVRAVATAFLRLRPRIVIPLFAFTVASLAISGAPNKQVLALSAGGTLISAFFLHEARVGAKRVVDARALLRSLVLTILGISVAATATGGFASPLLPMLAAPIGVGFAAFGRGRGSTVLLGTLAAVVVMLFAVSPAVDGLVPHVSARRLIVAGALVAAALLLRVGVGSLADAHGRAADALVVAADEVARSAVARTSSLESLGARVAHEVKNPLAAIRAIVEVMLESGDDRTKRRLSVAAGEIARIDQIISGYASLTHPFDAMRPTPNDVGALVDGLVAVLEARAARAGVELRLTTEETGPRSVPLRFDVDRDRLNEALLNLVLNALDATPPGGRVTLSYGLGDDGALELRVVDSGKGMDETTLAKLGTPFFTLREGGTGLGVAFARRIAEQHGGTLSYASVPGAGTTATIRLPRDPPSSDDGRPPNEPDTSEESDANARDATDRPGL